MKLFELRKIVYAQAQVNTTKALKVKYPSLKSLDFRRKLAWETALAFLSGVSDPANSEPAHLTYEQWLDNPPREYQELFANLDATAAAFSQHYATAQALNRELMVIADELESLGLELDDEPQTLPPQPTNKNNPELN